MRTNIATGDGVDQTTATMQLLAQRRRRRTEADRWATRRTTRLIVDTAGSGERLHAEIARALGQAITEVSAAATTTCEQQLSGHIASAAQALDLADLLATVLAGSASTDCAATDSATGSIPATA